MIEILKKQKDGYLVNGAMFVPNDEGNRDYQEVLEYIQNGGVVEEEYTKEELQNIAQQKINTDAREYLTSTDWYVIRSIEKNIPVPQDILDKRQASRESIVN